MIKRIFDVSGVDFDHWKALTKTALKIDLRASQLLTAQFGQAQVKATAALLGLFLFYTLMGLAIALLVWFSRDLFLTGTVGLGYVMFMVATAALLDHNSAITSPDDHAILGFRPVTSRTYFAARLTNVLIYTTVMTSVFAYLPIAAYFIRHGAAVGTASVVAVYAASTATTLTMMVAYGWLMRAVGPDRLKRVLSYVQFMVSFLVYGGYFLISQLVSPVAVSGFTLPKTPWLLLFPPTWFASYLEIAAGGSSTLETVPAVVSVVALISLAMAISGRLSLDYADRLGALTTVAAAARSPASIRRTFWFTRGEARAVALLIRAQFRNDMKFRMGVLAIVPLTIVYLIIGVRDGGIGDPFQPDEAGHGLSMVTIAVLMFPTMLKINLVRSDAFRASWIFFAAPVDRARVVRSSKDILVVSFLLPYLALVGALLAYFSTNVGHLLVHLLVIGLVSHLVLQFVTLVEPELPFSKPLVKGTASSRLFVVMIVVVVAATILPRAAPLMYRSAVATAVGIAALLLASAVVDRLTRLRVEAQAAGLEFEG